jgi:hypothetical protein
VTLLTLVSDGRRHSDLHVARRDRAAAAALSRCRSPRAALLARAASQGHPAGAWRVTRCSTSWTTARLWKPSASIRSPT